MLLAGYARFPVFFFFLSWPIRLLACVFSRRTNGGCRFSLFFLLLRVPSFLFGKEASPADIITFLIKSARLGLSVVPSCFLFRGYVIFRFLPKRRCNRLFFFFHICAPFKFFLNRRLLIRSALLWHVDFPPGLPKILRFHENFLCLWTSSRLGHIRPTPIGPACGASIFGNARIMSTFHERAQAGALLSFRRA